MAPGEPKNCSHQWVKNGFYPTKGRGRVQRWTCKTCGSDDKDFERPISREMLKALALLARRLPRDLVEHLVGVKSETIHEELLSVHADVERWAATQKCLTELGVDDQEVKHLDSIATVMSKRNRSSPADGPYLKSNSSILKTKIESIIGEEVVIARSRQGVRVCKKKDFDDFIRNVRKLLIERLKCARLSELEWQVLEQLRAPNAQARLLSRLDSQDMEVNLVTMKPLPPKLTLKLLADGLSMDFEKFKGAVIGLVRKLRKLAQPG